MNITLVDQPPEDIIFKNIYELVKSNKMAFENCLLIEGDLNTKETLVFTLKEPKRIFTVERNDLLYNFKIKGVLK